MIKHRLLLAAAVLAGALAACGVRAGTIQVELGDRPYFHGQTYWENDWEMIWVPGHWSHPHHDWIHGHYSRGQHRPSQKVQEDRDRHDNHQFDDARRHHRPRGS